MWLIGRPLVGLLLILPYLGNIAGENMMKFLEEIKPMNVYQKLQDDEGEDLKRPLNMLGTLPDSDWEGIGEKKVYTYNENFKVEDTAGSHFRQKGVKSRGSLVNVNKPCVPLEHKPQEKEPQGCGNPICVVIDRKPRRFASLCQFKKFLQDNSRSAQINFIQKGDCYDIIDNKSEGGAMKKPWSSNAKNCHACKGNPLCNGKVVVIVDIQSYLTGKSSAPGGGQFKATNVRGSKMSAFPFEFNNLCEAMRMIESREQVNIQTQVIGFALGCTKDLFTTGGANDKCVYTEWFDHDTACNSDKDVEMHSDHYFRLQSTFTGPYRICPLNSVVETQHEGGSEITQVMAEDARDGKAIGRDNQKFKQHIVFSRTGITCQNKDQEPGLQLPPPFIYNNDGNNTCLDYKSRYCCGTSTMWRSVDISNFLNRLVSTLPVGLSITKIINVVQGIPTEIKIRVNDGTSVNSKSITLKLNPTDGKVTGSIQQDQISQAILGTYKIIRLKDGTQRLEISIYHVGVMRTEIGVIKIRMFTTANVKIAISTTIQNVNSIISITQIDIGGRTIEEIIKEFGGEGNGNGGGGNGNGGGGNGNGGGGNGYNPNKREPGKLPEIPTSGPERYNPDLPLIYISHIILGEQKKIIIAKVQSEVVDIKEIIGGIVAAIKESATIWEKIQQVVQTFQISLIVDSPPLAVLFHECEWQDWTNIDYPDKGGSLKGEFELRHLAFNRTKLVHHVCGSVAQHAHYIDAVTMEHQVPWYELRMNNRVYEVFKLSPFFGYACKDVNGIKEYCKDMKVRYCCEKQNKATWGDWAPWSKCTKTCGGGKKIRQRACVQDKKYEKDLNYDPVCFGSESYQSAETKRRHHMQEQTCNLEGCPEDSEFGHWSAWGRCSITCGNGFKKSTRSCSPAKNGGKPCPDKRLNMDSYEKVEKCTQKDCEIFYETTWTPWSICSATCGEGVKLRKRSCMSDLTMNIVQNANCANDPDHFSQQQKCKLANCPVDGNWSHWSMWSDCSLNCVHHPDSKHPDTKTKAYRKRERSCSMPLPQYGGKPCARNQQYIFNANTDSEEERTDCITRDSPNIKPTDIFVDYCPEQCIYTLWGEWSQCTQTCVPLNVEMGRFSPKTLEDVYYTDKGIDLMPERSRIRFLVKPAKYGGSCPEQEANYDTPGSNNGSIIMQTEECRLCRIHCLDDQSPRPATERDIRYFEKFKYPDEEPGCIGYCPQNCKLMNQRLKSDCLEDTEIYLKDKRQKEEKYDRKDKSKPHAVWDREACFLPETAVKAAENGYQDYADKILEAFRKFIKQTPIEKDHFYEFGDLLRKMGREIIEEGEYDQNLEEMGQAVLDEAPKDVKQLEELLIQVVETSVLETFIEGLIGGENCKNAKDQEITSRHWMVEKDKTKYTHVPYWKVRVAACSVKICSVSVGKPPDSGETQSKPKCVYKRWAPWGAWGQCDIKCGDSGLRKRKRDCINTCTMEKLDNSECTPIKDTESDKMWTDTHTGPCTPCPPEVIGHWSTWSRWMFNSAPHCSTDGKTKLVRSRKRQCQKKGDISCPPNVHGQTEGIEEEKIDIPAPVCS